jgi:hypothetical protein
MSLEDDLFNALRSLVGNRVAPVIFPQPPAVPTWPAIRYDISTTPIADLCGDGEDETSEHRVQLDVVAATFPQARSLRLQVMAVMAVFDPPAIIQFGFSDYDEGTKTYREVMQYLIHGSSSLGSP